MIKTSRRDFVRCAAALPALPALLAGRSFLRWLPGGDDRCLLLLELVGGNDGLATVLPPDRDAWAAARLDLAAVRHGAHEVGGGCALHPALDGVAALMRDGLLCGWHGVGFAGADRSHFHCTDVRHTADVAFTTRRADTTGWLGRAADVLARRGAAVPGLAVGSTEVPLALVGREVTVPSLTGLDDLDVLVAPAGDLAARRAEIAELVRACRDSIGADAAADLRRHAAAAATAAVAQAERMQQLAASYRPHAAYPDTELGRALQLVARLLTTGYGTRLFWVGFGGFDTHARQDAAHAALLGALSAALTALLRDLQAHRQHERLLVLIQSEFGRRVAQNRSLGTDHGLAGPTLFAGGGLRPGLHGVHPSLTDLDQGDLKPTCDFRQTYAACLRWLGIEPEAVLGAPFGGVDPFA